MTTLRLKLLKDATRIALVACYTFTLAFATPAFAETKAATPKPALAKLTPVQLKRPFKLTGQIQLTQLDPSKTMERHFREAWDKKYGKGVLDGKFKIVVTSGNAITTLTSIQAVKEWVEKSKSSGTLAASGIKVTVSPEVKLILKRELGALAMLDLDEQVRFDLEQYREIMENQNIANSRVIDYNVMMDNHMVDRANQMMDQINAMVDEMFAGATDQIMGADDAFLLGVVIIATAGLAYMGYLAATAPERKPGQRSSGDSETITGHHARVHAAHSPPLHDARYYREQKEREEEEKKKEDEKSNIRFCPFCGSAARAGIATTPALSKIEETFNAFHQEIIPMVSANAKLMIERK